MGAAYAAADLVISRAGAGAVFETLALKKTAIFIPLEGQTRGDQMQNAQYFSEKKLCYLLPQSRLDELPDFIERAFADDGLKERLLTAPYSSGTKPALQIIRECLQAEKRP
jgi:UDP-N-acetylglucosamine--N-acetylmuramyl-(pentapeptide) pyrophosphoryl-undecaprenol N-acetylglucosamine transferase